MKRRVYIPVFIVILLCIGFYFLSKMNHLNDTKKNTTIAFKTDQKNLEIYKNSKWNPFFIKGINLHSAAPGEYPTDSNSSKKQYLQWLNKISKAGFNTIRLSTILPPSFYAALSEYNEENPNHPLYFIQGIWDFSDEQQKDMFLWDKNTNSKLRKSLDKAILAVYGEKGISKYFKSDEVIYKHDTSHYLIAWDLGMNWSPKLVEHTNQSNTITPDLKTITYSNNATPTEKWIASAMNELAEKDLKQGMQHPMTFSNWTTTDPIKHPNEKVFYEDQESINPENIKTVNWKAGYFYSYKVYPYYPDFLNDDKNNTVDTYKEYLDSLRKFHSDAPLIVSEFGVPSSIANSHNGSLNMNHGGQTEQEQWEQNKQMLTDIFNAHYNGAIVTGSLDEWYRTTWNTFPFVNHERTAYWKNVLNSDSNFGLLKRNTTLENKIVINDKKINLDDSYIKPVLKNGNAIDSMYMASDEGYLYLILKTKKNFDLNKDQLYIGIDTAQGGTKSVKELGSKTVPYGIEYLLELNKDLNIKVNNQYSPFNKWYGDVLNIYSPKKGNGFVDQYLATQLEMQPPESKVYTPFSYTKTSELEKGDSSIDNHAMWNVNNDTIKIRIPWMLLGFSDPSTKEVISYNLNNKTFKHENIKDLHLFVTVDGKSENKAIDYTWNNWNSLPENSSDQYKNGYQVYKEALHNIVSIH